MMTVRHPGGGGIVNPPLKNVNLGRVHGLDAKWCTFDATLKLNISPGTPTF